MSTIPTTKISQVVLEFAEPLIEELGEEHTKAELESVLGLAIGVWNACVLDQWNNTREWVEAMRRRVADSRADLALIDALVARKRSAFNHDPRAVGRYWVLEKDGELVLLTISEVLPCSARPWASVARREECRVARPT